VLAATTPMKVWTLPSSQTLHCSSHSFWLCFQKKLTDDRIARARALFSKYDVVFLI
jgi:hypothetical protein